MRGTAAHTLWNRAVPSARISPFAGLIALTFGGLQPSKLHPYLNLEDLPVRRRRCVSGAGRPQETQCFAHCPQETRHNQPLAFTMQQGPVPTQLMLWN